MGLASIDSGEISERTEDIDVGLDDDDDEDDAVEVASGLRLSVVGLARMFSNAAKALSFYHEYESECACGRV